MEGESTALRVGMGKLLRKVFPTNTPKVKPIGSKTFAVKRFKGGSAAEDRLILLIDLDAPLNGKEEDLTSLGLLATEKNVFYMVQEMEAWFISQPAVLIEHWGEDLFRSFKNKHPMAIPTPAKALEDLTKNSKHGKYHKISDGGKLLSHLDPLQLQKDFPDFKMMITKIKSIVH